MSSVVPGRGGRGSSLLSLDRLLIRGGGALLLGVVWSVGVSLSLQDTRRRYMQHKRIYMKLKLHIDNTIAVE